MSVMTIEGVVENGTIHLQTDVKLPEKTKVYVVVPGVEEPVGTYIGSPRLVHREQVDDFRKNVVEDDGDELLKVAG